MQVSRAPVSSERPQFKLRGSSAPAHPRSRRKLYASLADVIRSKEAAGREKDRVVLPRLRRLLDRLRQDDNAGEMPQSG
ncbi:MAG: hypothetical protein IH888_12670 [Planctomycetes bacterium]|nr:hypothetical protein [Planctomycetota bacterium]